MFDWLLPDQSGARISCLSANGRTGASGLVGRQRQLCCYLVYSHDRANDIRRHGQRWYTHSFHLTGRWGRGSLSPGHAGALKPELYHVRRFVIFRYGSNWATSTQTSSLSLSDTPPVIVT